MEALDRAIDSGPGKFRIRGGGHCYEDFVFNGEAQTLIDVSLLNEIGFDAQNGVYYAQSGATIWDLYRELYWRFGLTLPAGSCYSIGLGGHICGGGYGTLSRQFGLTVDWLTGVRVATVDQNERPMFNRATKEDSATASGALVGAHGRWRGQFRSDHPLRIFSPSDSHRAKPKSARMPGAGRRSTARAISPGSLRDSSSSMAQFRTRRLLSWVCRTERRVRSGLAVRVYL